MGRAVFKHMSTRAKLIAVTSIAIGNLAAATAGAIAWFSVAVRSSNIDTVAGDLNVDILKVTAHKYVYPYYANSAEFINYDETGQVESYVIEDADYPSGDYESSVTFTLGEAVPGTYVTSGTGTSSSVLFPEGSNFLYYLMGDTVFTGTSTSWSTADAVPFSFSAEATAENPATIDGVVLSCGAEFTLFDARSANNLSCTYLNYASASVSKENGARFEITESNTLRCLQAGIYSFAYTPTSLTITLHNRSNDAVIGNNALDPTKISIDYYATPAGSRPASIAEYLPAAIQAQNTMVVLDVELSYKNASEVDAGLKVLRNDPTAFDYNDDSANLIGYVNEQNPNPISASAFYAFYPVMSQASLGTPTEVWNALHDVATNARSGEDYLYSKFAGEGASIPATLHSDTLTEYEGKITLDASNGTSYHCYIGIDYDYEYINYFLNQNRIGKTYRLDRDFGFYFTATQHLEQEASS